MAQNQSFDLYAAYARIDELSGPERDQFLDDLRRSDPSAHEDLASLLAANDASDEFLREPVIRVEDGLDTEDAPDHWIGRELGAYRLTHRIGAGGTSVVYAAERSDRQFDKRVAVKLLNRDHDTTGLAKRLRVERQVLAELEHPNIARLLDGGETPDGLPFIVMEYVDGDSIDTHCDQRRFSLEARLRLFVDVCAAVEHAHEKQVIHRDLKPSNVLVDRAGVVKLLDFGIAKVTSTPGERTVTGAALMTPHYASPEQLRGNAVTPATDVYSLGVLLYELTTGQLPFSWDVGGVVEWIERVCHREPTMPSDAITRCTEKQLAARALDAPGLTRRVRGELDTIILKSLEKEPDRRYESPRSLGEDLERFLDGRPVLARGNSWTYRGRKWISRNRVPSVSVAITGLAVVGATALTSNQFLRVASLVLLSGTALVTGLLYVRAERLRREAQNYRARSDRDRRKSEEVSRFLKDMLGSITPDVALGKDTELLGSVLEESARRIGRDLVDEPDVAADIHVTIGSVYSNLTMHGEASAHLDRAAELVSAGSHPDLYFELLLARAYLYMHEGRYDNAVQTLDEADRLPTLPAAARRAGFLEVRARALQLSGRIDDAEEAHREALAFALRELESTDPMVAAAWQNLGAFCRHHRSKAEAEDALREAVRIHDVIQRESGSERLSPASLSTRHSLADLLARSQRHDEAETMYRHLLAQAKVVLGTSHPNYVIFTIGFASLHEARRSWSEAENLYQRALDTQRRVLGNDHVDVGTSLNNLAYLYLQTERLDESDRMYGEATEVYSKALGAEHPWVSYTELHHAMTRIAIGESGSAKTMLDQLAERTAREPMSPGFDEMLAFVTGICLVDLGDVDRGRTLLSEHMSQIAERLGEDHVTASMGRERLGADRVLPVQEEPR